MEHPRLVDQRQIQFVIAQQHIRAGLAGEGKISVTVGVQRDEGQRSKHGPIRHDPHSINARLRRRPAQQATKDIVTHLGQ